MSDRDLPMVYCYRAQWAAFIVWDVSSGAFGGGGRGKYTKQQIFGGGKRF